MPITEDDLYRAIKNGTFDGDDFTKGGIPAPGLLYPRFETTSYVDNAGIEQISKADVAVIKMPEGNEVEVGGGTSLFNVDGWFGFSHWKYFHIPVGTEYGANLVIKRGKSKRKNKSGNREGYHYQIEPKIRMTVDAFKGALDNFARSAIARQVEQAKKTK